MSHEEGLCELLYTPQLADQLIEDFIFLKPYYDYFSALAAKLPTQV